MHLKENLIEHFDYEAVTPEVWRHLYSWYSADWCIMRYVRKDFANKNGVFLDLYPESRSTPYTHLEAELFATGD